MTPGRVAVRDGDRSITYADLHDRAARLARGLRGAGVRTGDRVAYLGPNQQAFLDTLFACGQLGAVFVPVNFRLTRGEIDHVMADSGASVLVFTPEYADVAAGFRADGRLSLVPVDESGVVDIDAPAGEPIDVPVSLEDVCLLMYTSGSTGAPKAAMLTHGNLTWNSVNVLVETDVGGDERTLIAAPLFHTAALSMICLPTLLKGGMVILHPSFEPGRVLATIEAERVTWMFGVPAMYNAMAAHEGWAGADLSSMRTLLCGGSPVAEETIRRYLDRGLGFVQGYGMTETAPGVLYLDRDHAGPRIGSAGVPSFFTDIRLVDDQDREIGPGEKGEIVVSGPNVMRGYWGKPAETAAAMRDGWFHSGDIASVDEDGYFFVVDRLKDMIISGGENVYPAEVESRLQEFPGVEMCVVIGVPDAKWGEVGKAVVVARPGVELDAVALLAFLRERLAGYKVPRSVVFADELPVTGSGKIRKAEVRKRYGQV